MENKECPKCGEIKNTSEFDKHPNNKDGLQGSCKKCLQITRKKRDQRNKLNPDYVSKERARWRESKNKAEIKPKLTLEQIRIRDDRHGKNIKKIRAKEKVYKATQRGILTKQPCSICNSTEDVQAHHWDYDKPLDVIWLCRRHHAEAHIKLRESTTT